MNTYTKSLNWLVLLGLAAAFVVFSSTYRAPVGGFVGTQIQVDDVYHDFAKMPVNVPTWEEFKNVPEAKTCHKITKGSDFTDTALIVDILREPHQTSFDHAYALTHFKNGKPRPHSDVWVIGFCN